VWAHAKPTDCGLYGRSVCDVNSAAAACGLWRYTSVICLCLLNHFGCRELLCLASYGVGHFDEVKLR